MGVLGWVLTGACLLSAVTAPGSVSFSELAKEHHLKDPIVREYIVVTLSSGAVLGTKGRKREYFIGSMNDWYQVPTVVSGFFSQNADSHLRTSDSTAAEFIAVAMILVFAASYLLPKRVMENNFTNSLFEVWDRPWTLLTSTFSHEEIFHLLANTVTLMETGPAVEASIGTRDMAQLFLVSGAVGWIGSLGFKYARTQQPGGDGYYYVRSQGASGAIMALLATMATSPALRTRKLAIHLPIPMPGMSRQLGGSFTPLQVILGFIAQDLFFGRRRRTDFAAHWTGLVAGALFGWVKYS